MVSCRQVRRLVGRIALDILAVGGVACILLVVAAMVWKVSIVMFATGSMTPTIPQGSIAFVREVPATDVEAGDVVTVDRGEQLPITHRVLEIVETDGDAVTFTMQGDANDAPDPAPYTATTVRTVLWSVPGLAHVIVWLQQPLVLGAITIGTAALVTWAFWPRASHRREDEREGDEDDERIDVDPTHEPQHAR